MYIYAMSMPLSSQSVGSCCCGVARRSNAHLIRRLPLPLIQSHSQPEETEFMTETSSSSCSFETPFHHWIVYEVGLGFICARSVFIFLPNACNSTDLPLAASHGDVDETASVSEPLLGAALRSLLLLLGLNLFPACQPP